MSLCPETAAQDLFDEHVLTHPHAETHAPDARKLLFYKKLRDLAQEYVDMTQEDITNGC